MRAQIINIRNERDVITRDSTNIKRILMEYYKQLCDNKFENLDDVDKLLEWHKFPKIIEEKVVNINIALCLLKTLHF